MKLITRDTDYALRALCYSACHPGQKISVKDIVKKLEIPRSFLRKICQRLNKKGILKSYKGKGGGFELAINPNKIYLIDLIEIFQGPLKLNECMFKNEICPDIKACPLSKKIERIQKYVFGQLGNITVKSLIDKKGD